MFEQILAMGQVLRDQRYPPEVVQKIAHKRLRDVLISAFDHTPYYREAMRAVGYNPRSDFRGPEELIQLPIFSKKQLP